MSSDNLNRIRVKQVVLLIPGIHLRMVQRILGTSFSTARYHVDNLERDGQILRSKKGHYDRLYPVGTTEEMKGVFNCLQSKSVRTVLRSLLDLGVEPTHGDISKMVDLPGSTTTECLALLTRTHLVERTSAVDGRIVYRIKDPEGASQLLTALTQGWVSLATEGFIDLWDL
ncbi:MAG: hypothetical protein OK456_03090 [Thaumarchaeota archaeon]|nr:hypothetical protein [Nitrososphaerota archaeon]